MIKTGRGRALAATAACLGALAVPAFAHATEQRFWVSANGTQTTTWSYPYFVGESDCYHVPWSQSKGSEVIHFQLPKMKVLAMEFGKALILHWGNWNFDEVAKTGPLGGGYIDREASETDGVNPGPCGGSSSTSSPKFDCGRKSLRFDVLPAWRTTDEIQLTVLNDHPSIADNYNTCPVYYPQENKATGQEVTIPPGTFDTITTKFPKSELFDRAIGKEIVLGKANYDDSTNPGERPFTASTAIRWTLTFTKAR